MDAVEHTRMLIPLTIAPSQRRALSDAQPVNVLWPGALALALHLRRVGFLYCYRLMLRSLELMAVEATLTGAGCETQI
jgi:hypothetical protein